MATENSTPAAPRGAGAAETQAPTVREKIREVIEERMALLVNWCQGPIDVDTAARHATETVVEMFKKYVETKRWQIGEVLYLYAQDVYLGGCRMDINNDEHVDRIVRLLLEGL